jgi:Domain of unknown function (DUF5012)
MKKLFIYTTLAAVSLMGCNLDLETEGISRITYFPEFVMEGEDFYLIDEGDPFVDPGIEVLEQGTAIPFTSTFRGRYTGYSGSTIGTDPDQYNLTYDAVNKDGFAASESRTIVAVNTGDLVTSIEGAYTSNPVRINGVSYAPSVVMIWKVAPNVYEISCSVGGFYADGRGDGDLSLSRGGTITINNIATNDFTFTTGYIENFDSDVGITSMTINPATKTITFVAKGDFANGLWNVTMTQIQP